MALSAPPLPIPAPRGATSGDRGATAAIRSTLQTVALLGNHLPRQCGIATFTTDLGAAIVEEYPESTISFLQALRDMRSGNR